MRNDVAAVTIISATCADVKTGWHALEFHGLINDAASTTEVWLGDIKVADPTITANLGVTAVAREQTGGENTGCNKPHTGDIWSDRSAT